MNHFAKMTIDHQQHPDAPVPGAVPVWGTDENGRSRPAGWLMPEITQATAEASPGIQTWSHPRGKGGDDVQLDDKSSILNFSDYCARHLIPHYPQTK